MEPQQAGRVLQRGESLVIKAELEKAFEERDVWFPFLPRDPAFAPLLAHPRASALLRRAGIP